MGSKNQQASGSGSMKMTKKRQKRLFKTRKIIGPRDLPVDLNTRKIKVVNDEEEVEVKPKVELDDCGSFNEAIAAEEAIDVEEGVIVVKEEVEVPMDTAEDEDDLGGTLNLAGIQVDLEERRVEEVSAVVDEVVMSKVREDDRVPTNNLENSLEENQLLEEKESKIKELEELLEENELEQESLKNEVRLLRQQNSEQEVRIKALEMMTMVRDMEAVAGEPKSLQELDNLPINSSVLQNDVNLDYGENDVEPVDVQESEVVFNAPSSSRETFMELQDNIEEEVMAVEKPQSCGSTPSQSPERSTDSGLAEPEQEVGACQYAASEKSMIECPRAFVKLETCHFNYDPDYRAPMDLIRDNDNPAIMLLRMCRYAVEGVSLFLTSIDSNLSFLEAYDKVDEALRFYYLYAPPSQRRFLLINEYRIANEMESRGSKKLRWCALCRLPKNFKSDKKERRHFENHHLLVQDSFSCPNCNFRTNFVSKLQSHIGNCCPESATTIPTFLPNDVADACTDYKACKNTANHRMYLIRPGYPSFERRGQDGLDHNQRKLAQGRMQMDVLTGRPVGADPDEELPKMMFKPQKNYCTLKSFDDLRYGKVSANSTSKTVPANNAYKKSSSAAKKRSSAVKKSSSAVKESSSAVKESSSAVKGSSSAVKESSSAVKKSSSAVKKSSRQVADTKGTLTSLSSKCPTPLRPPDCQAQKQDATKLNKKRRTLVKRVSDNSAQM